MDAHLFDQLPILVCETVAVYDDAGKIIDLEWTEANRLMNESILPDGGSIIGMRIFEFDPSYRQSEMVRNVLEVMKTGQPATMTTSQGRGAKMFNRVMKTKIVPTKRGVLCCSHEITDIANERDEAKGQARLLEIACDHAAYGITISNQSGRVVYANDAMAKLSGYRADEIVGKSLQSLGGIRDLRTVQAIAKKIASGEEFHFVTDNTIVNRDGEDVLVSVALNNVFLPGSKEQVFVSLYSDVREERRKEQKLKDALQAAEEGTRLKSEFLANMSHEIRTPLNGVLGMAQTLTHEELTESQAEQVSIILDSGRSLMALLNDILDLSKIEAGKLDVTPVATDLRHKLSSVYKLHQPMAAEKGIDLKLHIDPGVPSSLMMDAVRVRQCVSNIVSNAIKFTSSGTIMIVAKAEQLAGAEQSITIHVSDTGCGIAHDKLDRVFESFSQEDGSITRKFGGTGLGLSITRRLARMMGGDVTAVSEQGRGSVFTLTIKAEKIETARISNGPTAAKTSKGPRRVTGLTGCRALVVDDNSVNLRVARTFLEQSGLEVTDASDGQEALSRLSESGFDIVLMDIHMPGVDGTEALRRLRMSNSPNRLVPVIALTADSMRGDREKFLATGFDGYVSKPIDERALITAIGQVLYLTNDQVLQQAC